MKVIVIISQILFKETIFYKVSSRLKVKIYEFLTKKSLPIFLRGGDVISTFPQALGYHEIRVKQLINYSSQDGYSDFLLDIGANIGLSSCQSGDFFREVHCYEPNPDCFQILKINTKISLEKCKVTLNNFGLGLLDGETRLFVPRGNWGGAFIHDDANAYSDEEVGSKDGYVGFSENNYEVISVQIRNSFNHLTELFSQLNARNLRKGFIKIDVEGYENVVLEAIAESLPHDMEVMILFECFTKGFDPSPLLEKFHGRAEPYRLVRSPEKYLNKLTRIFKIIAQFGYIYQLKKFDLKGNSTDIVFIVK